MQYGGGRVTLPKETRDKHALHEEPKFGLNSGQIGAHEPMHTCSLKKSLSL